MKPINALAGALALSALTPLAAQAQTPPADSTPTTGTTASTTTQTPPPSDEPGATTTGSAATAATPATPATPSVGATVYGSDGAEVGKITSVSGGNAVVDTGTRKATLALNSFGSSPQGPTITVTRGQLEDMVARATPASPATPATPASPPARSKGGKNKPGK